MSLKDLKKCLGKDFISEVANGSLQFRLGPCGFFLEVQQEKAGVLKNGYKNI